MNKIISFVIVVLIQFPVWGQNLSKNDIINAVQKFKNDHHVNGDLSISDIKPFKYKNQTVLFIINLNPKGFIILANEKRINPVLGYSLKNSFITPLPQSNIHWWLENYAEQIWTYKHSDIPLRKTRTNINYRRSPTAVSPILSTTWNQGSGYNQYCPADPNGPGGHAYTGCIATAAGQVMKKWEHPVHGNGSFNYTHPDYGVLSADFENTNYNWAGMDSNISDVALLLYQIGVAVKMNYGPNYSSSSVSSLSMAFKCIFNFHSSYLSRSGISEADWIQTLKNELDNDRPVIYRGGTGSSTSHAWVCDGYDNNNMFHMNWGWGGNYNGYYSVNDLTPGSENYNSNQAILYQIYPVSQPSCEDPYEAGNNDMGIDNDVFRNVFSFDAGDGVFSCLTPGDEDWYVFSYDYNGEMEFIDILVKGANSQVSGSYYIKSQISGHTLTIETKQYGLPLDTKLQWKCMSVNGTYPKVIMEDDNGGENGIYSKLIIDLDQISRTIISDQNFKTELYYMDIAFHPFISYVFTEYINHITSLQLNYKDIDDFTGIEGFESLESFWCHHNNLTSLDVSQNHQLKELVCRDNQLTELILNPEMEELFANRNQLTDIVLTNCSNLKKLNLSSNNFQQLDLRNGNPYNITHLYLDNNPSLSCVFVDDANYFNTNFGNNIDPQTHFVETQAECDAFGIDKAFTANIVVFPNPFNDVISIDVNDASEMENISIRNVQGQTVYSGKFKSELNLSALPAGIYFMHLKNTLGQMAVIKLIKR